MINPYILILCCFIAVATANTPSCLVGRWYNELGSVMEIYNGSAGEGVIRGRYNSNVGDAKNWYTLRG